jgi:hypothetical protein
MAQPPAWELLGSKEVRFSTDRDIIPVGAKEGRFSSIKIKVKDRGVHFIDLKIHFINGEVQDVPLKSFIRKGEETRVIDLQGGNRRLEKIELVYESKGRGRGQATVLVFGKHN